MYDLPVVRMNEWTNGHVHVTSKINNYQSNLLHSPALNIDYLNVTCNNLPLKGNEEHGCILNTQSCHQLNKFPNRNSELEFERSKSYTKVSRQG